MKKSILYAVLVIGTMAVSCSKSGLEEPRTPGEPNAEPVTVALSSVSAPTPVEAFGDAPGTKSSIEMTEGTDDGQVHDLWAIQYDASGKLVGSPYYTADIPAGIPGAGGSGMDYNYDGLSVKLTSSGAATHTVCFVANTHNGSLFTVDNDVTTLDKLKAAMLSVGTEYRPTKAGGIVMLGKYTGAVASGTPVTGVKLERMAAKVVLRYKVGMDGFTVTGVQLKNAASGFRFAEAAAGSVDFPAATDGNHIDYPAEDVTKAAQDGDYKRLVWYVPENLRKAVTAVTAAGDRTLDKTDGKATYIEVSGILREGDRCRKAVYRILPGDLGSGGTNFADFNVRRNHIYTVTLDIQGMNVADNRVTVESFDMNNCAMIQPATTAGVARDSVTFDIRKCLNNGFTTASGLQAMLGASSTLTADVLWQDGDIINTADVMLDKVNGLLTVRCSKTNAGNAVVALYPDANKAQGTILWSWHIWVTTYSPSGIVKHISGALTPNTAYPNASAGGQVHTYGTEYMKVNAGKVIMDRNLGATKAYNGRVPAANDATADQAFGLFYQWGRKDPFPRVDGSTVVVNGSTSSGTMIPIYGPSGTALDAPSSSLSATGFRRANIADVIGGSTNTLALAVKNPLLFIYNPDLKRTCDWYAEVKGNQNDDLWGDGALKSPYDPCPKGWRVPVRGTWNDFTRNVDVPQNGTFPYYENGGLLEGGSGVYAANGRLYQGGGNPLAWFPATGYCNRIDGELSGGGREGYCWSSTPNDVNGSQLYYTQYTLNPINGGRRSHGISVRCIQE